MTRVNLHEIIAEKRSRERIMQATNIVSVVLLVGLLSADPLDAQVFEPNQGLQGLELPNLGRLLEKDPLTGFLEPELLNINPFEAPISQVDLFAQQGSMNAQFAAGYRYLNGIATAINRPRGIKLLSQAAVRGHKYANFELGKAYGMGKGVPQDHARAFSYFVSAANKGEPSAAWATG